MLVTTDAVANKSFDYIVVGGGNAGLPLAARLSDDPNVSVLLLEAGDANLNHIDILRPGMFSRHFFGKDYVYQYMTSKQLFLNNGSRAWLRGKGLGGSAAVNFMLWMRPPAKEIDDLERLGNSGWNWKDLERITRKIENFFPPTKEEQQRLKSDCDQWNVGTEGPLPIAFPATIPDVDLKFQETVLKAGIGLARRPLDGDPTGTFFAPSSYDPTTHTRSYPTTAYYLPVKDRPNLSVLVFARCNRLITEKDSVGNLNATGVEFEHAGQTFITHVRREAIISAGALQSPHIVELSGIGRRDVLEKINIPLQLELPGVGENVQEHLLVAIAYEICDDVEFDTLDVLRDHPELVEKHIELQTQGKGSFTMGLSNITFTSLNTISANASSIIQRARDAISAKLDTYSPGLQEQYKIQLDRLEKGDPSLEFVTFPGLSTVYNPPTPGKRYFTIAIGLNHPFSRGFIHSASADPAVNPEIDPRCFEQDVDLYIMTELVKFVRSLGNLPPFKDIIAKEHNPGPSIQSDEEIREWIKDRCSSIWHTAGSCSMLPKELNGVVDPKLKVYGTNNIRVADISIVPLHLTGHPSAFVYYIAEKAAEIIKESQAKT